MNLNKILVLRINPLVLPEWHLNKASWTRCVLAWSERLLALAYLMYEA